MPESEAVGMAERVSVGDTTDAAVYNGWYAAVYMPAAAPESGNGEEETV